MRFNEIISVLYGGVCWSKIPFLCCKFKVRGRKLILAIQSIYRTVLATVLCSSFNLTFLSGSVKYFCIKVPVSTDNWIGLLICFTVTTATWLKKINLDIF